MAKAAARPTIKIFFMFSFLVFSLVIFSCFYLGTLVYTKNPKNRDNKLFFLLIFWMVLWLIANYLENQPFPAGWRIFFLKLDFVLAPIMGYFWFLFCYYFLSPRPWFRLLNIVLLVLALFSSLSVLLGKVIVNINTSSFLLRFQTGQWFIVYALLMLFYFLGGVGILIKKYKELKGEKKIQVFYVLTGFFISSTITAIINLFLQNTISLRWFYLGTYCVLFLVGFTSYAIIRHRLFDIRSLVQRSLIYSVLLSLVVGFYLLAVFILGYFFQRTTKAAVLISAGLTTVLGIWGVPYVESYFRRLTNKIFFKDYYDYSQAIFLLSRVLNKNIELKPLARELAGSLTAILSLKSAAIILFKQNLALDPQNKFIKLPADLFAPAADFFRPQTNIIISREEIDDQLDAPPPAKAKKRRIKRSSLKVLQNLSRQYQAEVFAAMFLEEQLIGLLALGEKKSGDLYSQNDFALLKTVAYQAAVALEKARLYEEVKAYSQTLEEKVRQRTAKIKGLQEAQRQMMLEISHGLQTPLTILKGEITLLRRHLTGAASQNLANFEKSIDRISQLIYRLLHLARLDSDPRQGPKQKVNFSSLLAELVEYFSVLMQAKNIQLKTKIEKDIYIFAHPKQIEELVTNLVSNAVKYMKKQGPRQIEISLRQKEGKAELVVSDTGVGIAPRHLPFLFTQFYRAGGQEQTPFFSAGTGLGLAICKKITENHQGSIKVQSQLGQGTTFIVLLPILK